MGDLTDLGEARADLFGLGDKDVKEVGGCFRNSHERTASH